MLSTGLPLCAMTASVKSLGNSLPASQSGFIRYVFGLLLLAPFYRKLDINRVRKSLVKLRRIWHAIL